MENYNLLRQLRQTKDVSQEKIAHEIGVTLRHYQNIEKGSAVPSIYIGLRIARFLKVEPYKLWNMDKNEIER